ncbi:MAG: LytTR family DNA-binding domain-containing protein [Bacteroidales bacterium]|jgi:DNA-binding LytR/AlgR family response regulator|nr:LytTR family DNA-binding domain-containing protein [Bacteroidales bacterium]
MPFTTVIIDDEQPAINILSDYVGRTPLLNLKIATRNVFEAIEYINNNHVDILLLDIEMPDLSGIELIKLIKRPPIIILTTAYEKYALDGYELDIVDYLVKPIRFERFIRAINKANRLLINNRKNNNNHLIIKVEYQTRAILLDNIIYIEGLKDYVKIYTNDGVILTRSNIKGIHSKINDNRFVRIHRSYIVNTDKIVSYTKRYVTIGSSNIPIGDSYRSSLPALFIK